MPDFQKIAYHLKEVANELCSSPPEQPEQEEVEQKQEVEPTPDAQTTDSTDAEAKCDEQDCDAQECEESAKGLPPKLMHALFENSVQHIRPCDRDLFCDATSSEQAEEKEEGEQEGTRAIGNVHGMRKIALLHGLNYNGSAAALHGCINDVQNMQRYLTDYCQLDAVLLMTDLTHIKPFKSMMNASYQFIFEYAARTGGTVFYQFSGHGTQQTDWSGDESVVAGGDGKDEMLVPLDYRTAGCITDDALNKIWVQDAARIAPNVRFIFIHDACHSGSVLDLRYKYGHETKGGDIVRTEMRKHGYNTNIISISGCKDEQTSSDVRPTPATAYGALSNALVRTLKEYNGKCTYRQLMNGIYAKLQRFSQLPQLCSEQELDLDAMIDW